MDAPPAPGPPDAPASKHALEVIDRAWQQVALVNDLLDVSAGHRGQARHHRRVVDVRHRARRDRGALSSPPKASACSSSSAPTERRRARDGRPPAAPAGRRQPLGNAVKFTPAGVVVEVRRELGDVVIGAGHGRRHRPGDPAARVRSVPSGGFVEPAAGRARPRARARSRSSACTAARCGRRARVRAGRDLHGPAAGGGGVDRSRGRGARGGRTSTA